jgi:predicted outer membrane repeat protein
VGTAGDVNGDGYADLVVGAPGYDSAAGRVYVYYGGGAGLTAGLAAWTTSGENGGDGFGSSVGTAGDVNGDGYTDLVVGAPGHSSDTGKVYVYHSSVYGLNVPSSELTGENAGDYFGSSVGTAGDVNGDGFSDLVVGAPGHSSDRGKAYVYHGSLTRLTGSAAWSVVGGSGGDNFGQAVGTAGDAIGGDGYADLVVGAPGHSSDKGKAYVYRGNVVGGREVLARQARGDGSTKPVQPWGVSYSPDSFQISMRATHPLGRGGARLQVQACPPGVPFGDSSCLDHTSTSWVEAASAAGTVLNEIVTGLDRGTLYRWRARVLYDSPFYIHGPWRRFLGQALEADVRSSVPGCDLTIHKAITPTTPVTPGAMITYTLTFYSAGGPATNVVITDVIPSGITDVTVVNSGAAISDTGVSPGYVWNVQDLTAGEGGVITITGVASSTRFINTAIITTTSPDVNPANNISTVQTHIPGLIYVDADAAGPTHDGQSWLTAYMDLQDGLSVAASGDEVWVAEGVYKPTDAAGRTAAFTLTDGVRLYGGFEGGEVWRHQRDWAANPTVLNGDIGTTGNDSDNVYHVISVTNVTSSTVLDGFTVIGGNADGGGANSSGGGMFNDGGSPTLLNVTFSGNFADAAGGGMYNSNSSAPTLVNVAFSGNSAGSDGGGMFNTGNSNPTLLNVTFSSNSAGNRGGGVYNDSSSPTLHNSILWGNTAAISGSQIYNSGTSTTTVNYSDVEGGWSGTGNVAADPAFYDADGADDVLGTLDDDLRLRYTSSVIDIGDNSAVPQDDYDLDGDGVTTETLPLDLSGRSRLIGFTVVTPSVDMGAYEANILDPIAEADALLESGLSFRMEELQLLPADTLVQAMQNYQDFNDGEMFYDFCADYDQIDEDGYCPDDANRQNVRNTLLDAIELYGVALDWPTSDWTTHDGEAIHVWGVGGSGVVSAAHEIANVHLIFGNEFLVDAIDYRFSLEGIPYADQIINKELGELEQARRQFELTVDLLFRAFGGGEWGVGAYFTSHDFETFGVASSRMMTTLDELAARYRMLGDDQAALSVYDHGFEEQYLQLKALAQMAGDVGAEYLQNGSWEMFNNLSQMRGRAQAIRDGLDFFGFAPDYVPLQPYDQLLELTEGPIGNTGLLGAARDLEDQAREAQRTFDRNASDMSTELDNLTVELSDQLFELCGESEDGDGDSFGDYDTCEGGLMDQNLQSMYAASLRIGLAWRQAQNIAEQIQIEQERAGQVIQVDLGLAQTISAAELAIGKLQAYKETRTQVVSAEAQVYAGVEAKLEYYTQTEVEGSLNPFKSGAGTKSGLKASIEGKVGFQISGSALMSTGRMWDPNAEEIGEWNSIKTLRQAEAQAEIVGANSAATVKNLLLQQSEALLEYEIAIAELNKLAAEHNHLAQRRSRLLNKRYQAINRVANHNSHLLSPAYRIMRDTLTIQSAESHELAAQFAYLTARASEYELLTPYPALNDIYKARTANDIRLFLNDLKVWYQALDLPGQLNRYPYTISVARDILGLTDENLDPGGRMTSEELDQLRYELFQAYLQDHVSGDGRLEFWFTTSLDQRRTESQYLFSPNIWNNRIAGVGAPLAQNEGVSLNIVTRQASDVGVPEVVLVHDGQTSYRNAAGGRVNLDPDTAVPVGYPLPAELDPENTTVVLRPGINGAGAIPNSGLVNLSVAASSWKLRIPADSKGDLDFGQIEDIEIYMDTSGRALPGMQRQATRDALRLQAGLELEPVSSERFSLPAATSRSSQLVNAAPTELIPSNPNGIGGSYFGSVVITSPLPVALQVLNFGLVNLDGVLSGTVNVTETALYNGEIGLHGVTDGDTFTVTSDVINHVVLGRDVQRQFTLVGYAVEGGEILKATYTDVVTNLLPSPVVEQGRFSASRPGTPGGGKGAHSVYLPLVIAGGGQSGAPDLVVQEIVATSDDVQVVIRNVGNASVSDGFWVDVYIDPTSAPTAVNQIWNDLADEGLVWGVQDQMGPGGIIVLSVGDANYRVEFSQVSWPLVSGTPVYVQVDSWNPGTSYGAVLESHEQTGDPYENNIGYTTVQQGGVGGAFSLMAGDARSSVPASDLPPRLEPQRINGPEE